jgi:alkylation response protein AidB-like acyl-CoA dehydrogenase
MKSSTARKLARQPTRDDLLGRARELAAFAKKNARETEQNRRVSAEFVSMMKRAELFRILQPKTFGGFEYDFKLFVEAASTIAAGCPSSGWVGSIGMAHQWLIALFPLEAQKEVWSEEPDAIAYGSYAPAGKITVSDTGYSVSGKWAFSSGCDNAQWYILGGLMADDEQKPVPAFLLVNAACCSIEDNWYTMGLAGTGSKIVVLENVGIARHAVVTIPDMLTGNAPGGKIYSNPLYRIPLLAVLPLCLAAPTMGMAIGALDTFMESMQHRVTRGAVAGANSRMAEFATVQLRMAEASGCIDAGRQLILRDIAEVEQRAERGGIDVNLRIRNRLDHAFCTKLFVQAVDALFLASGGNAIYLDKPIQRYWRDIHAAGVHISLNWDAVGTMYGQHVLGLEPKGQY